MVSSITNSRFVERCLSNEQVIWGTHWVMHDISNLTEAFLGREVELGELTAAWELARQGVPQIRVIVADSGYGKTKMVQALYSKLSEDFDPEGFWPKSLLANGRSLRVTPDMVAVDTGPAMPWFWWGVRWPDPDAHNALAIGGPLLASISDPAMQRHVRALSLNIDRRASIKSAGINMGKALLALVPGAEVASQLVSASLDILEAVNIGREYRAKVEQADLRERNEAQATATIIALFTTMLEKAGKEDEGLPVVLFLDDAQWMDSLTVRMLDETWRLATMRNWPLLIIATHWRREWLLEGAQNAPETKFATWFYRLRGFDAERLSAIKLGRLPKREMGALLRLALPGLDRGQSEYFLEQASGNPRYVVELAAYLRKCPEKFVAGDFLNAMKEQGFFSMKGERLDITGLEERRFNEAIPAVKKALGLSSLQGGRFINQFTVDVAQRAAATEVTVDALRAAERPYVLAESLPDHARMEFRSRAIQSRSMAYIFDEYGDALTAAFVATIRDWIDSNKIEVMRLGEVIALVRSGLDASLVAEAIEDATVLVDFLARKMKLAGDFSSVEGLLSKLVKLTESLDDEGSSDEFKSLLSSILSLMDELQGAGYPLDIAKEANAIRRCAQNIDSPRLTLLATRVHVQALMDRGEYERALRLIPATTDGGHGEESALDWDRLLLLRADAELALGRPKEAAAAYQETAESLEKSDIKFGAFHHAAITGEFRATLHCMKDLGGTRSNEDLALITERLKAYSMARLLAGSICFAQASGPYPPGEDRPPQWVEASVRHDYGMAELARTACLPEGELMEGALKEATQQFEKALSIWDSLGVRADLRAWTVLACAIARLFAGRPSDQGEETERAFTLLASVHGDAYPGVAAAKQISDACQEGKVTDDLMFQVLTHGWMAVDYDLLGPP